MTRRQLLIGGGAGLGLVVAWAMWPRRYAPNLTAAPGEAIFGAWLKIGRDGHVTVALPQAEHGQGVFTALPQILADELGADWRTVAVEPAPLNPLYANPLGAEELFEGLFAALPDTLKTTHALRSALVLTAGSSSVRAFEAPLRTAGAAARVLLAQAAAARWGGDWRRCDAAAGFIVHGKQRLRFAELAEAAAGFSLPADLPLRPDPEGDASRLVGQSLPRLDVPAKVDGSANFAGDVRLPGLVHAAIRQPPPGHGALIGFNRRSGEKIPGFIAAVDTPGWLAAVANNGWAAERALTAMGATFARPSRPLSDALIAATLSRALDGPGTRMAARGDLKAAFHAARVVTAEYRVGFAPHAALETPTATAQIADGAVQLWLPSQAPGLARAAVAAALGVSDAAVTVHPMQIGGSFGAALDHRAAVQAALIARAVKRPVQLVWSRAEDLAQDGFRPAAAARMTARLGANGSVMGWLAKIAAPRTGAMLVETLMPADPYARAALALEGSGDAYAVAGALPFYRFPNLAVDHHPVDLGVRCGHWRSGAHSYTAFFTECFLDELAHVAGVEPLSFRVAVTGEPRLVRCLSTAASLGGWEGGVAGSGQGIACHSFRGSHIAVLAEAHFEDGQIPRVDRLVAAVDCGRQINPDLVMQQIEGGLIFGMAAALGGQGFAQGRPRARRLADLHLPLLADSPDITVELIRSEADPGGVSELAVPPVAPAIANALRAASGIRPRQLPLVAV